MVRSSGACRGAEGAEIGCSDAVLWPRGLGELGDSRGEGARSRRRRAESSAFSSQGSGEEGSGRGHGGAKHGEHCSHAALRLQEEDEEALADSPLNFFSYLQLGPSLFLLLPFKTSEF